MKKIRLTENELISLIKQTILEDQSVGSSPKKDKKKPNARCIPENVLPLDEIAGLSDDFITYGPGIQKSYILSRGTRFYNTISCS